MRDSYCIGSDQLSGLGRYVFLSPTKWLEIMLSLNPKRIRYGFGLVFGHRQG